MPTEEAVIDSTPVESSAPSEVSAQVETSSTDTVTPSESSPSKLQDDPNWSDEQFIGEALKKIGSPEEQTAEVPTEAAPETPTEEAPATEEAAAEKPGEEAKPEEEEPALDLDEPIAPSALEQKINSNPELKALLDKDPSLRGEMFKAARLGQETFQYKEVFPTVESAKIAAVDASERRQFEAAWNAGPKGFIDSLVDFNTIKDANGNPVKDANGHIQVDPSLTNVLDFIGNNEFEYRFNNWLKEERAQAEREGNDEAIAALDILTARKNSPNRAGASEDVPEHIKTREAALKAKEDASARQDAERLQVAKGQAFDAVIAKADISVNKLIDPIIDKSALSDFAKKQAKQVIHDKLEASMQADREYQSRKLAYDNAKHALSEKEQGEYSALVTTTAQNKLGRIIREVMEEAGKPAITAQAAKQQKVAAQQKRSQQELRGAATPATQKPLEGAELVKHLEAQWDKSHPGVPMDDYQLLLATNEYKTNLRKAAANR